MAWWKTVAYPVPQLQRHYSLTLNHRNAWVVEKVLFSQRGNYIQFLYDPVLSRFCVLLDNAFYWISNLPLWYCVQITMSVLTRYKPHIDNHRIQVEHIHILSSSNGNIFRVTGPLRGKSQVTGGFPSQRPMTQSFDVWTNGWANNWDAGDLRHHNAHYDDTVMRPLFVYDSPRV